MCTTPLLSGEFVSNSKLLSSHVDRFNPTKICIPITSRPEPQPLKSPISQPSNSTLHHRTTAPPSQTMPSPTSPTNPPTLSLPTDPPPPYTASPSPIPPSANLRPPTTLSPFDSISSTTVSSFDLEAQTQAPSPQRRGIRSLIHTILNLSASKLTLIITTLGLFVAVATIALESWKD